MQERNAGLTKSEQILALFGRRSFLSLWSHANVYRAPAKELCDLLVIFDEHVIIFSDKTCKFSEKPLELAWSRWQREAIEESIKQLFGAERWMREQRDRVFLDSACTQPFPFPLPPNPRFHLVCIANGATDKCRENLGGSGSLVQVTSDEALTHPFMVNVVRSGRMIHLLDEFTAPIVFNELDTAPDFLAYLMAKEAFFLADRVLSSTGEENTLAAYLAEQPNLIPAGYENSDQKVIFSEGLWPGVSSEDGYIQLQEIRKASQFFDEWIDQTAEQALAGEMYSGNEDGVKGHEERLRLLARASRSERHALTMVGLSLFAVPRAERKEPEYWLRCVRLESRPDTIYAFALVPEAPKLFTPEEYRQRRQEIIRDYCFAVKAAHPEVSYVVGLASAPPRPDGRHSEDICYVGGKDWTPELEALARDVRRLSGFYSKRRVVEITGDHYATRYAPLRPERDLRRRKRNEQKRLRKERRR